MNVVAILSVAICFRFWHLGNVPGLNGDEAWYGVKAIQILQGHDDTRSSQFWLTPTGNPVNPFFLGLQVLFHSVFSPSIQVLRLPAVLSGILTLLLNYRLCRREYGRQTALVSTTLLAVLPVMIAYSRFAWDASQTMLFAVPTVYLALPALSGKSDYVKLTLATLACLCAVVVHPTNIFMLPIVILAALACLRSDPARWTHWRSFLLIVALNLAAIGIVIGQSGHSRISFRRLFDVAELAVFLIRSIDLFSGATIYQYIAGGSGDAAHRSLLTPSLLGVLGLVVASGCAGVLAPHLRSIHALRERRLFFALATMIGAIFVITGSAALRPGYERYGLSLIVPIVVLLSVPLAKLMESRHRVAIVCVFLGIAWAQLIGFHRLYFDHILSTGGTSEMTFRTAKVEPKLAAFDAILQEHDDDRPIRILTDRWWNYWSLRYFATAHSHVDVIRFETAEDGQELTRWLDTGRVWFVVFENDPLQPRIIKLLNTQKISYSQTPIADFNGRPTVWIIRADPRH